jgi:hypothetical protein
MNEIKAKLDEYDSLLMREQHTLQMRTAGRKDHEHFRNYMWQERPLAQEEADFVYHRDDMLDLYTYAESNWVHPMIEAVIAIVPAALMRVSRFLSY